MSQTIDPRPRPSDDPTPYLSRPDAHYEIVDGEVVEKPAMGMLGYMIATRLWALIDAYLGANRLGFACVETIFILDAVRDLRRCPDVAFVSFQRWPEDRELPEEGDCDVVPDLAIEIVSPNDRHSKVIRKVAEYFRYGVRQVWLVQPQAKRIEVYRSPKDVTILEADDELDGNELLPGFRMAVGPLFRLKVR